MKGLRKAYRGERGFTLVELLVVVVILGVLAAVATLAVTKFIGSGNVQAANTEMHNAKTAVAACMYAGNVSQVTNIGTAWNGDNTTSPRALNGVPASSAAEFVNGTFKASYVFLADGSLVSGSVVGTTLVTGATPWSGVAWDTATLAWKKG